MRPNEWDVVLENTTKKVLESKLETLKEQFLAEVVGDHGPEPIDRSPDWNEGFKAGIEAYHAAVLAALT